jgi:glycosyltransferase involved in cell wall biosynthesis
MIKPCVSVIIPLYNKQNHILRTLNSLLKQTFTDWECIIVDDGSTDSSVELVSEFISKSDCSFKLIETDNYGQSRARNIGIAASKGKYVAFLDGDDLWLPNKLERQVSIMEINPKVVMVLGGYSILEKGNLPRVVIHKSFPKLKHGWMCFKGFGGGLESVALIRSTAIQVKAFDEELSTSAGLELFSRIGSADNTYLIPDVFMGYLKYPGQWHRGFEMLKKDTELISERLDIHSATLTLKGLNNYENLIFLKSLIRLPLKNYKTSRILTLFRFDFLLFLVIYISRQMKAYASALRFRQRIRELNSFLR